MKNIFKNVSEALRIALSFAFSRFKEVFKNLMTKENLKENTRKQEAVAMRDVRLRSSSMELDATLTMETTKNRTTIFDVPSAYKLNVQLLSGNLNLSKENEKIKASKNNRV